MSTLFLRKLCCVLTSLAIAGGPVSVLHAQTDTDFRHAPESGWEASKTSKAVLANTSQAFIAFAVKKKAGTLTAADVEVAASSMKTAMDHLQEINFNSALEAKLLANEQAFLAYHPSEDDIQVLQQRLAVEGVNAEETRVRSLLDLDYQSRVQFLTLVKKQGLYKTQLQFVEQFRTEQLEYVSQASSGVRLSVAQRNSGPAKFKPASYNFALCLVAAGVGLGSGCTVTIFACEAAVILCGACAASSC